MARKFTKTGVSVTASALDVVGVGIGALLVGGLAGAAFAAAAGINGAAARLAAHAIAKAQACTCSDAELVAFRCSCKSKGAALRATRFDSAEANSELLGVGT